MSDIDGEEENVRPPSRSSTGTLRGDNTNTGSGSPVRGENRPLDEGNEEFPLPSRNSVQPCAQESASTLLNYDYNGLDRNRDHDAINEDSAKPQAAKLLDHDSELNGLRDSRQSSLDSRLRGFSNDQSKLPVNSHGRRSYISNGTKRKSVSESYRKIYQARQLMNYTRALYQSTGLRGPAIKSTDVTELHSQQRSKWS